MIHENSISPESAIQGTGSLARRYRRGASWKDTTQHGQGERRVENADKIMLCFSLCAFWSHQRIHFHIKLLCSSQQELPSPWASRSVQSPAAAAPQARLCPGQEPLGAEQRRQSRPPPAEPPAGRAARGQSRSRLLAAELHPGQAAVHGLGPHEALAVLAVHCAALPLHLLAGQALLQLGGVFPL